MAMRFGTPASSLFVCVISAITITAICVIAVKYFSGKYSVKLYFVGSILVIGYLR
jgi:hypothetical protein